MMFDYTITIENARKWTDKVEVGHTMIFEQSTDDGSLIELLATGETFDECANTYNDMKYPAYMEPVNYYVVD